MNISTNGLDIIKKFEALSLTAYLCPANKLTIGYGHVIFPRDDFICFECMSASLLKSIKDKCEKTGILTPQAKRLEIDNNQADALLNGDCRIAQEAIKKHCSATINQNQYDALCSFVFNVGTQNFKTSTLLKLINVQDFEEAAKQFDKWCHSDGKKLQGLVSRRKAEQQLFDKK